MSSSENKERPVYGQDALYNYDEVKRSERVAKRIEQIKDKCRPLIEHDKQSIKDSVYESLKSSGSD